MITEEESGIFFLKKSIFYSGVLYVFYFILNI